MNTNRLVNTFSSNQYNYSISPNLLEGITVPEDKEKFATDASYDKPVNCFQ